MTCNKHDPTLDVNMHINDLADFVFTKNVHNAEIFLQLFEVEDIKDLFFFCLDLFCKGLVLMYGEGNRVTLEDITMEQFAEVRRKLLLTGIEVFLHTEMRTEDDGMPTGENRTIIRVDEKDENELKDYKFTICTNTLVYEVHFELTNKRK